MLQSTQPMSTTAPVGIPQENDQVSPQLNDTQLKVSHEPPTGKQFLEKLRDGRVIYFDGNSSTSGRAGGLFMNRPRRSKSYLNNLS
jgi:hypothetical protein